MEIKHFKNDLASYMTFENIYDEQELLAIWQETYFLCREEKFLSPKEAGSATDFDGRLKKRNKGIWMHLIYTQQNISNYLNLYKKAINSLHLKKDELISRDHTLKLFFQTNTDATLLSYYENDDYYEPHIDISCFTYVFFLFKEPKKFNGGDLIFPELNQTIKIKSNMAVLFPSWLEHQVDKIEMCDTIEKYNCDGRFSFITFYNIAG